MEVGKLFAAGAIAILLVLSVTTLLSTFYRPPSQELTLFGMAQDGSSANKYNIYQNVTYSIMASLSIVFLIVGFLLIKKESLGAGFIGGGVLLLTFGDFFTSINMLSSLFSMGLSSLSGGSDKIPLINYLNSFFTLAMLALAITFSYLKLEKPESDLSSENIIG